MDVACGRAQCWSNLFLQRAAAIVARNSFWREPAALACHFLTRTMLIAMVNDRRGMTR